MKYLVVLLLILASCSSVKTTKINPSDYNYYYYSGNSYYRKAFFFFNSIEARNLANGDSDKIKASEILSCITNCKADSAYILLNENSRGYSDTLNYYLGSFIENYELYNYLKDPYSYWAKKVDSNCAQNVKKPIIDFNKNSDTLNFDIENGLIVVKIEVDGKECRFIWDTNSHSIIGLFNQKDSDTSGFCKYKINALESSIDCRTVHIDSINIGNFTYKDFYLSKTIGEKQKIFNNLDIEGIIGWDIIKDFDNIIDFKNQKIILNKINSYDYIKKSPVKNFFFMSYPIIWAYLPNGEPIVLILDLGSNETYLCDYYLNMIRKKKEELDTRTYQYATNNGVSKVEYSYVPKLDLLIYDNLVELEAKIRVSKNKTIPFLIEGALGTNIFRNSKIHFNIASGIFEFLD